jgi:hypothetical protein
MPVSHSAQPLSNHLMVLSYTGVKSGSVRHVPLTYLDSGNQIIAFCNRDVTWWKNLRGGAPVALRLRGQTRQAMARPVTDDATRMNPAFLAFLRKNRQAGGFNAVPFDATGEPDDEAVAQILPTKVMIQVEFLETRTTIAQ